LNTSKLVSSRKPHRSSKLSAEMNDTALIRTHKIG